LYATNLLHLLTDMTPEKDGQLVVDMEDEVIRGATVVNKGEITWPPPAPRLYAVPEKKEETAQTVQVTEAAKDSPLKQLVFFGAAGLLLLALGSVAPPDFMSHFTVFVLSCFIGYMVIWNVSPSLHTPLMSVTNAISSIIIIGALLQISSPDDLNKYLAAFAILITSVNIVGGFAVTQRMLEMFRK
jgi:NAD(P) transhydrogenase subunit alpha